MSNDEQLASTLEQLAADIRAFGVEGAPGKWEETTWGFGRDVESVRMVLWLLYSRPDLVRRKPDEQEEPK